MLENRANLRRPRTYIDEMRRLTVAAAALLTAVLALPLHAADPPLQITRAAGAITIDGDLADPGWKNALKFDQWFETNPGDNVEPKWKTLGWITYDDKFFYAAVQSFDDPKQLRAQLGDHDGINGNGDDFAGVLIDSRNDGKTALELFANAAGTQYDAVLDDAGGNEDSSPDVFWDSAVKRTADGWILEMRVPFSSLRYDKKDPQTWGIMLYRNTPRERRYQMFTHRLPRGQNCFVCNYSKVTGFTNLPAGGHVVVAPYMAANISGTQAAGPDDRLTYRPASGDGGVDVKWTPNEHTAVDATLNPDFSQVESDVAAITANERFAIFYPEKRPFFLERVELLNTPISAVYTRSITSPRFGGRSTANFGRDSYTILIAQDRGGGSTIIPSALGSDFADQDFDDTVFVGRWRHDVGKNSFFSFLATTREIEGGAHNRVLGPDFQWKPNDNNTFTGQVLVSDSKTPDRLDLHPEWNGQKLRDWAGDIWWSYSNPRWDLYTQSQHYGEDFRADNGFVPQVGYQTDYAEGGRTFRPKGFFNRIRVFAMGQYDSKVGTDEEAVDGAQLYRLISAGFGADGKFRSFLRIRPALERFRAGNQIFNTRGVYYSLQFNVSRVISQVSFDGYLGENVDFSSNRRGRGARVNTGFNLRPTTRLTMSLTNNVQWLSVRRDEFPTPIDSVGGRLFTSMVNRLRAQYMFTPQMFLRAIVQNQRTNRNRLLYGVDPTLPPTIGIPQHGGNLAAQLLFGYRVNWQSVLFVGYGDLHNVVGPSGDFVKGGRTLFTKVSYAFQR
jgi:hypothetical protein